MSTIQETQKPARSVEAEIDRFRYGFRNVQVTRPDGSIDFDQIPLTLEDALHPEEGDRPVSSRAHALDCNYLHDVVSERLAGDRTAAVLSDTDIYWEKPEWKNHRPDIAVILGVRRQKDWPSFYVAEEGTRPALIIEVVSLSTRVNDVETKVEQYAQVGVPHYVIADARESDGRRHLSLIDYRLGPDGLYEPRPLDGQGRVRLEELGGLSLGIVDNPELGGDRLALFDAATGKEIGDYTQLSQALAAKEAALAAAEARVRDLEVELQRLRGNGPAT
ncbi:MAG: Uma2 family endonuclease [Isosphaerales bacterium]